MQGVLEMRTAEELMEACPAWFPPAVRMAAKRASQEAHNGLASAVLLKTTLDKRRERKKHLFPIAGVENLKDP